MKRKLATKGAAGSAEGEFFDNDPSEHRFRRHTIEDMVMSDLACRTYNLEATDPESVSHILILTCCSEPQLVKHSNSFENTSIVSIRLIVQGLMGLDLTPQ